MYLVLNKIIVKKVKNTAKQSTLTIFNPRTKQLTIMLLTVMDNSQVNDIHYSSFLAGSNIRNRNFLKNWRGHFLYFVFFCNNDFCYKT